MGWSDFSEPPTDPSEPPCPENRRTVRNQTCRGQTSRSPPSAADVRNTDTGKYYAAFRPSPCRSADTCVQSCATHVTVQRQKQSSRHTTASRLTAALQPHAGLSLEAKAGFKICRCAAFQAALAALKGRPYVDFETRPD